MSKKFKLLALTLACTTLLSMGTITAFASAKTEVTVEDSFNDPSYEGSIDSGNWVATLSDTANPSIKQSGSENPSMQFVAGESGGERVQYGTLNKIENIESVEFSLKMPESIKGTEKWFAVNFVPQLETSRVRGSNHYYSPIMINPKYAYAKGENQMSATWSTLFSEYIAENGSIVDTWISFKIIPTSDTAFDVYIALRADTYEDTVFPEEPVLSITGTRSDAKEKLVEYGIEDDISYKNAYVLFGSEGTGHGQAIDDVKIVGSNMTVQDDFTSVMRSEDLVSFPDGKLGSDLKIVDNNNLQITGAKAGDRIVSHARIEEETSIAEGIVVFEASFRIKMAKTCQDEIAFVFGLDGSSADPTQNSYAYAIGKDYGRVLKYRDGEVVYDNQENTFMQITSKKGAELTLKVYKDGSVEVFEDGILKANLPNADTYQGNFGFVALSDTTGTIDIDNVIVKQTTYYVPVTKSVTHNFSNDFIGNLGKEDFVLNNSTGGLSIVDGKLYYNNCSDSDFFGSAHQYDSFILDFQLCSIDVSEGRTEVSKWIGFDVGKPSKNATNYGLNVMFGIEMVPAPGKNTVGVWSYCSSNSNTDQESIKVNNIKGIPSSLFRDIQYDNITKTEEDIKAGDAVCFRWVSDATNENLKLYIKKASESEFTLYAEIKGVNASGYQAICCTGWSTFKIDNFSMSNTSPIYEIADNETPEKVTEVITEVIYTDNDVDVNWDEEIRLNGTVKGNGNGTQQSSGCKGAVTGGASAVLLALLGACLIRKKNH